MSKFLFIRKLVLNSKFIKIKRLKYLIKVTIGFFNDDYIFFVNGESRTNFQLRSYGDFLPDKIIYLIEYHNNISGFFAILIDALVCVDFADRKGFSPIIYIGKNTHYYDQKYSERVKNNNVFEYFFENIDNLSLKNMNLINYSNAIHSRTVDRMYFLNQDNFELNLYDHALNSSSIKRFAELYRKYFRLNDYTTQLIENDILELNLKDAFISVHFRGTDFKRNFNNHPKFIDESEYFHQIQTLIQNRPGLKIFLATDDLNTINRFRAKYTDKLYYFKDNKRAIDKAVIYENSESNIDKYLNGYEVLRDAFLLSKGEYFLGGSSNVSTFSRILKIASNKTFIQEIIFHDGINKNKNNHKVKWFEKQIEYNI